MEKIDKVLFSYQNKKIQIEIDKIKLEELNDDLSDINACSYDGIPSSSYSTKSQTEEKAIKLYEKKKEIEYRIKRNTLFCKKIEKSLETLTYLERFIIESFYFQNKKDYEIYLNFNYGISKAVYYKNKKSAKEKILSLIK